MISREHRDLERAAARVVARFASTEGKLDDLRRERLDLIRRMFAVGFTTAEIARIFDVSRSWVGQVLGHPHGKAGRPKGAT